MKTINILNSSKKVKANNIFCVGLNYSNHIKEMNSVFKKSEYPVIFLKPNSAIITNNETIIIPDLSNEVNYETELVVFIKKDCYNIPKEKAYDYILGYSIGIDVTLRDIQKKAKENGHPWALAKGFYTSAPVSDIILKENINDIQNAEFSLYVNDELKQKGNTKDMLFKIDELVSYLSKYFSLKKGDLIFTGTPEGVGLIKKGDKLKAILNNSLQLNINVEKIIIS